MEFKDFLEYCYTNNYHVVIFNTSLVGTYDEMWCHIVIAQNCDTGNFVKGNGFVNCLDEILDEMSKTIDNLKIYG